MEKPGQLYEVLQPSQEMKDAVPAQATQQPLEKKGGASVFRSVADRFNRFIGENPTKPENTINAEKGTREEKGKITFLETPPQSSISRLRGGIKTTARLIKKGAQAISDFHERQVERGEREYQEQRTRMYGHLRTTSSMPAPARLVTKIEPFIQEIEEAPSQETIVLNTLREIRTKQAPTYPEKPFTQEEVEQKLIALDQKTKERRTTLLEKLEPSRKKLLGFLDQGVSALKNIVTLEKVTEVSQALNKNVGMRVKLGASVGLCVAGLLAAPASPAVIVAIGGMSITMRTISTVGSTAGAYVALKKRLDAYYKKNTKISRLKMTTLETGAVLAAAFAGTAIGALFEHLAETMPSFDEMKDMLSSKLSPYESVNSGGAPIMPGPGEAYGGTITNDLFKINPENAIVPNEVVSQTAPSTIPETLKPSILESIPLKDITYEIHKGDTLWSALRKTLQAENFEGFSQLSGSAQETKIRRLIDAIAKNPQAYGVTSGNINLLKIGDTLSFTKLINP